MTKRQTSSMESNTSISATSDMLLQSFSVVADPFDFSEDQSFTSRPPLLSSSLSNNTGNNYGPPAEKRSRLSLPTDQQPSSDLLNQQQTEVTRSNHAIMCQNLTPLIRYWLGPIIYLVTFSMSIKYHGPFHTKTSLKLLLLP